MRVLVTGHHGYIGSLLAPMLADRGHDVVGVDSWLFEGCDFPADDRLMEIPSWRADVRDVSMAELEGYDAVVHLAGISNDPLGDLDPETTQDINHRAAVQLAERSKRARVRRFLFSSTCSLYGAAGELDMIDESAPFHPVTPYGISKVNAERDIAPLASDDFSPVFPRSGTAYGVSPRLRGDLVVNNLVGFAATTGRVLLKSDGTPWRPLVHVEDIARAFVALLEAPVESVHNQAFNVGRTEENYQIRDVARIVESVVPNSTVTFAQGAGPDIRDYRVNCDKIAQMVPGFRPRWSVRAGVEQLWDAFHGMGLSEDAFVSSRFLRIKQIVERQESGELDEALRWREPSTAEGAG